MQSTKNETRFSRCKFYPAFRNPAESSKIIRKEFDGYAFCIKVGNENFELIAHHPIAIINGALRLKNSYWIVSEAKSGCILLDRQYKYLKDIAEDADCNIVGICAKIQNNEIFRNKFQKVVDSTNEVYKET